MGTEFKQEIEQLLRKDYHECEGCNSKHGSPVLFSSCLQNRALVNDLKNALSTFIGLCSTPTAHNTTESCLEDLADFCIKWGDLPKDAKIYSAEVSAAVDDVCRIKVGLYANKGEVG